MVKRATDEIERPNEWLRRLRESARGYAELMRESGEPVVAAYRIAAARCRAGAIPTAIPTLREVHAAACELIVATEETTPIPSRAVIADECDFAGLMLIGG